MSIPGNRNVGGGAKPLPQAKVTTQAKVEAPKVEAPVVQQAPATEVKKEVKLQATEVSAQQRNALSMETHNRPTITGTSKGAGGAQMAYQLGLGAVAQRMEGQQASVGLNCTRLYRAGDKLPTLQNLPKDMAALQKTVNTSFEQNPKFYVESYTNMAAAMAKPGEPVTFSPDEAKGALVPEKWVGAGGLTEEVKAFRAGGANAVLHQAAHACAQMAFVQKLDELGNLPPGDPKRNVLVTNGGCGAGKGYALKQGLSADFKNKFGAVWDAAGEQCALDNQWIMKEAAKRGIKTTLVYVHADPEAAFGRAVGKRFEEEGRLVNKRSFAESYVDGAINMRNLVKHHKDAPGDLELVLVNNTGAKPEATVFSKTELAQGTERALSKIPMFDRGVADFMARLGKAIPEALPAYAKTGLSILD
jgi:hypothetical protein